MFAKELGHLYAEKVLLGALVPCGGVEQWNDMMKFDEKLSAMQKSMWDSMEMLRAADRASLAAENAVLKQRINDLECAPLVNRTVQNCSKNISILFIFCYGNFLTKRVWEFTRLFSKIIMSNCRSEFIMNRLLLF